MKIKELKNKIIIAELDPKADYVILVRMGQVRTQDLEYAKGQNEQIRKMPVVGVYGDIDKAIRFVEVPKN